MNHLEWVILILAIFCGSFLLTPATENERGSRAKWPIFSLLSLAGITFLLLALVAYPGYAEGQIRKRWNAKLAKLKDSSRVWRETDFAVRYVWKSADGTHAFQERDGNLWVFYSADAGKFPGDLLPQVEKDRSKLLNCLYDPTNGTASPGIGFVLIEDNTQTLKKKR